jgi:cell division protein FtsI (penicillin-binding protein 3)
MAIGYEVAATPLQILTAYSALANGGLLVEPHVVAERQTFTGETTWTQTPDSIRRALRRSTTETLRPAFERVVEEGTATEAQIEGLRVAGKTGTALSLSEQGAYDSEATRATFVGFLPADDPDVALLVMVGRPQSKLNGGVVAAPIFRRIARRWANTFPDVVNRIATHRDTTQAARAERTAETADAAPTASARWRTADALPDLTGLSARQAAQSLRARDVRVTVNGTGTVVAQTPAPGRSVPNQATLRCR